MSEIEALKCFKKDFSEEQIPDFLERLSEALKRTKNEEKEAKQVKGNGKARKGKGRGKGKGMTTDQEEAAENENAFSFSEVINSSPFLLPENFRKCFELFLSEAKREKKVDAMKFSALFRLLVNVNSKNKRKLCEWNKSVEGDSSSQSPAVSPRFVHDIWPLLLQGAKEGIPHSLLIDNYYKLPPLENSQPLGEVVEHFLRKKKFDEALDFLSFFDFFKHLKSLPEALKNEFAKGVSLGSKQFEKLQKDQVLSELVIVKNCMRFPKDCARFARDYLKIAADECDRKFPKMLDERDSQHLDWMISGRKVDILSYIRGRFSTSSPSARKMLVLCCEKIWKFWGRLARNWKDSAFFGFCLLECYSRLGWEDRVEVDKKTHFQIGPFFQAEGEEKVRREGEEEERRRKAASAQGCLTLEMCGLSENDVKMVSSVSDLEEIKAKACHEGAVLGLDCEFFPGYDASGRVGEAGSVASLLQIAILQRQEGEGKVEAFLVDLLSAGPSSPQDAIVAEILSFEGTLKLGVSFGGDLEALKRRSEAYSAVMNYVELGDTVRIFARKQSNSVRSSVCAEIAKSKELIGLSRCSEAVLGAPMDKFCQMSDWMRRPLEKEQFLYAALDAISEVKIFEKVAEAGGEREIRKVSRTLTK